MLSNSTVARTGQNWKLAIAVLALLIGSIVPAFSAVGLSWTAGTVLACAGYAFGIVTIRCPDCRTRWFWTALTRPEVYRSVLIEADCPVCGRDFAAAKPVA